MSRTRFPLMVAPLALVVLLGVLAASRNQEAPIPAADPQPVGSEGMRVAFDPETGDMIPATGDPQIKGPAGVNRSHEGLTQVINPDGSAMVDLQGRFQCSATATVDAQGQVHLSYSDGPALVSTPAAIEE